MTVRRLLAVFAVLALFLAACGDDGGGLAETATEPSGDDSSSSGSEGGSGSGDADPGDIDLGDIDPGDLEAADDFIDAFLPEDCEFFFDFTIAVGLAFGGQDDLSSFKTSDAPEEVRDDVQTVLDAIEDAPDQGGLFTALSDPEVEDALENIEAFATANCELAE